MVRTRSKFGKHSSWTKVLRGFATMEEPSADILANEKRSHGKVISIMAHEVNNIIGAINSILDTTLQLNTGSPDALQVANVSEGVVTFATVLQPPSLSSPIMARACRVGWKSSYPRHFLPVKMVGRASGSPC